MTIKKNDFVEIEYTGKIKDEDIIFDTTDEKLAKEEGIHRQKQHYGPMIICVGQGSVMTGIDNSLEGRQPGTEYNIELQPEDAFGKKSAKLVQLIPLSKFKKHGVQPQPGLQVNIDDSIGIIKTVSGGRVLVDFNHPLSGKVLDYKIKISQLITDDKEKIKAYMKFTIGMEADEVEIKEGGAAISFPQELPKEVKKELENKFKEIIPGLKDIEFKKSEEKPKTEEKKEETTEKPDGQTETTQKE